MKLRKNVFSHVCLSVFLCTGVPLIVTTTHDVISQSEVTWDPIPWLGHNPQVLDLFKYLYLGKRVVDLQLGAILVFFIDSKMIVDHKHNTIIKNNKA